MIRIVPPDSWDACDRAIGRLGSYDAIIFTSANAVESFFSRCRHLGVADFPDHVRQVFAVGPATAAKVEAFGVQVQGVPDRFSSADLAGLLLTSQQQGLRLLNPRGNIGREEVAERLREGGATVDEVVVYNTAGPDPGQGVPLVQRIEKREFDAVTFASPSAVNNFAALLPEAMLRRLPEYTVVAVIGPTTGNAVEALGLPAPIVGAEATAGSLIDAIADYFKDKTKTA